MEEANYEEEIELQIEETEEGRTAIGKEMSKLENELEIEFQIQPLEVSGKSASLYSYNPNSNQNHSKIVYQDQLSQIKCTLLFHFSFMTAIADFVIFQY